MIQKIPITDYHKQDDDILIDLRDNTVFSFGTLTGAVNIPMNDIEKLYALPKDKRIVLFCQQGDYSAEIAELLGYITHEDLIVIENLVKESEMTLIGLRKSLESKDNNLNV